VVAGVEQWFMPLVALVTGALSYATGMLVDTYVAPRWRSLEHCQQAAEVCAAQTGAPVVTPPAALVVALVVGGLLAHLSRSR
jgi:hypothetical protein